MLRYLDGSLPAPYNDDGLPTHTSKEQAKVERNVLKCLDYFKHAYPLDNELPKLNRQQHMKYLKSGLFDTLSSNFQCLDCSRPWLVYWITHGQVVLENEPFLELARPKIIEFFKHCSNTTGGYGGGPQQYSHLAATYATINALVSLSTEESLRSINRESLLNFLCDMKQRDGSYVMHQDGEVDVRGVYCAISVAKICGLKDERLWTNTAEWVASCQTYEGGFAGVPGGEAHGGYTFCAVAALALLGAISKCNLKSLTRWVTAKQLPLEGGFAGRTNKLVDGCYSFWQGAVFPILHAALSKSKPHLLSNEKWLFNQKALQEYLLCCCQQSLGGLIDKPGRPRDYYHTCYGLAGLSVAQNAPNEKLIIGGHGDANKLISVHPIFNISDDAVLFATEFFK